MAPSSVRALHFVIKVGQSVQACCSCLLLAGARLRLHDGCARLDIAWNQARAVPACSVLGSA